MRANGERDGFRREVWALRLLSEALEQDLTVDRPAVAIGSGTIGVTFYVMRNYSIRDPDEVRAELEGRFGKVMDLFPGLEWVKNDPTGSQYDEWYYTMEAAWHGGTVKIISQRKDLCERVVMFEHEEEEEVPDPEYVEKAPKVKKVVKKEVVEWQCNSAIAERTAPQVYSKEVLV